MRRKYQCLSPFLNVIKRFCSNNFFAFHFHNFSRRISKCCDTLEYFLQTISHVGDSTKMTATGPTITRYKVQAVKMLTLSLKLLCSKLLTYNTCFYYQSLHLLCMTLQPQIATSWRQQNLLTLITRK